ncbi:hypothetical protein JMK10_01010 [Rhodovulum sulfidophilum]|uniref:hypothetical protein n=1 Tax=Rhodovulum sulfidophilum TaxID=35806 RepID=UPI001923FB43|nr:hypothetical protein [Rhodovulum sulfidophilum]MBL3574752.1 hypothetical protein [Rhodovulum sulfidophilum]MCE8431854.1 hypothetical protein [Rhodovulum sulfidophilum]MCF4115439.1 hypothetical protein [Rhodovulum sulfidophilum]
MGIRNAGTIGVAVAPHLDAVVISKKVSLSYQAGASAKEHEAIVKAAVRSAFDFWQEKASALRVRVGIMGCPGKELKILFKVDFVDSGADLIVRVDNTPKPSDPDDELRSYVMGGTDMTFYMQAEVGCTMMHEIGHALGLNDECLYGSESEAEPELTVRGHDMPDVTFTLPLLRDWTQEGDDGGKSYSFARPRIMGTYATRPFPATCITGAPMRQLRLLPMTGG